MPSSNSDCDLRLAAKLFALLDSPEEEEARAAVIRLRAILRKCGMPFYEAVETHTFKTAIWEAMGHPVCLRDYFEAREMRQNFAKLDAECDELADAVAKYRQDVRLCRSCETKRRFIAVCVGVVLARTWCLVFPPSVVAAKMTAYGVLVALAPLLGVLCHWRILRFKLDLDWVSVTDNKLYRAVANKWNRFIGGLVLS